MLQVIRSLDMKEGRRVRNIALSILVGVALLAVGIVVASAVFSGQQLILRFLITVVVAALGFYIISDLRLQKTQILVASPSPSSQPTNPTGSAPAMPIVQAKTDHDVVPVPPANSTAAYMARASSSSYEKPVATHAATTKNEMTPGSATNSRTTATSTYSSMGRVRGRKRSQPTKVKGPDSTDKTDTSTSKSRGNPFDQPAENKSDEPTTPPDTSDISADDEAETTANATPLTALDPPRSMTVQNNGRDNLDLTSMLRVEDLADSADDEQLDPSASSAEETTTRSDSPGEKADDVAVELVASESANDVLVLDADLGSEQLDETPTLPESAGTPDTDRPLVPTKADSRNEPTNGRRRYSPDELEQSGLAPISLDPSEANEQLLESNNGAPSVQRQQVTSASKSPLSAINDAIFEGEQKIVKSLIDRGVLSSKGPITDDDVATMVYVAFTSSELRKLLASGGSVDGDDDTSGLEEIEIYTSDDLADADQFLVAGPESTIDVLEAKVTL